MGLLFNLDAGPDWIDTFKKNPIHPSQGQRSGAYTRSYRHQAENNPVWGTNPSKLKKRTITLNWKTLHIILCLCFLKTNHQDLTRAIVSPKSNFYWHAWSLKWKRFLSLIVLWVNISNQYSLTACPVQGCGGSWAYPSGYEFKAGNNSGWDQLRNISSILTMMVYSWSRKRGHGGLSWQGSAGPNTVSSSKHGHGDWVRQIYNFSITVDLLLLFK